MQADLFTVPPAVEPSQVEALIGILRGQGWRTAKSLLPLGYADRQLRALAHASKGQIVGGQKGYALVREISDAEADRCEAFLLSQARQMVDRAREIRIARNRRETHAA